MIQYLNNISSFLNNETFFWFCALSGTGMFLIQLLLNVAGLSDAHDDASLMDALTLKWISKQTVTSFLMMFGWVALTCQKEFGLQGYTLIGTALTAGLSSIFITAFIFKMIRKLQSPGTIFNIEDALGKDAVVYHRIPAQGVGKVSLSLHDMTHEIDAISMTKQELPSFSRVHIIKKLDEKTVVVSAIK